MAESAIESSKQLLYELDGKMSEAGVKHESVVKTERESHECVVCANRSDDNFDIYYTKTSASQVTLLKFLCNFTRVELETRVSISKFMCKFCYELVNILDQAEVEYTKLKINFESIISKNPLFDKHGEISDIEFVKNEMHRDDFEEFDMRTEDSDDEPLAITKSKRRSKPKKSKKKVIVDSKKKIHRKQRREKHGVAVGGVGGGRGVGEGSAECAACGDVMTSPEALADHMLTHHVKTEPLNSRLHSPNLDNGYDCSDSFKVEIAVDNYADDDEDHSQDFLLKDEINEDDEDAFDILQRHVDKIEKRKKKLGQKKMLKCDQCDAKYSTPSRLAYHRLKHDASKPPYICEICGAHYKHKKACDIHIALHKGISDWKCEECNKLFPSKAAMHRHNNIHTGKANYQCDLCGKSFIHTSSFKMHKLAHSGLKPHSCRQCGLALMTRSHLKRHERVHSGEKRHECGVCGKRFSERYNLLAHGKAHETRVREAPSPTPSPAVPPQPRRRLFRCAFCSQRFERRYMLERHTEAAHERTLERAPPKPRNTMSKLLKAQAAAHAAAAPAPVPVPAPAPTPAPATAGGECAEEAAGGAGGAGGGPRGWHAAYTTYTHHYTHAHTQS